MVRPQSGNTHNHSDRALSSRRDWAPAFDRDEPARTPFYAGGRPRRAAPPDEKYRQYRTCQSQPYWLRSCSGSYLPPAGPGWRASGPRPGPTGPEFCERGPHDRAPALRQFSIGSSRRLTPDSEKPDRQHRWSLYQRTCQHSLRRTQWSRPGGRQLLPLDKFPTQKEGPLHRRLFVVI